MVTIADDANEPSANAIDDASNFVRQNYHDFLNREPDASGLAFWTDQITSCGSDQACIEIRRINVSAAFFLSIEFQDTVTWSSGCTRRVMATSQGRRRWRRAYAAGADCALQRVSADTQEIGQGVIVGQTGWEMALENNKQASWRRSCSARDRDGFPDNDDTGAVCRPVEFERRKCAVSE